MLHFLHIYKREREREREIFLKEYGGASSKSARKPVSLENQEELQFESKGSLLAEFLLAQGRSVFVLLRPSIDCMRLTHIMEDNVLYSKSINLNVNLL